MKEGRKEEINFIKKSKNCKVGRNVSRFCVFGSKRRYHFSSSYKRKGLLKEEGRQKELLKMIKPKSLVEMCQDFVYLGQKKDVTFSSTYKRKGLLKEESKKETLLNMIKLESLVEMCQDSVYLGQEGDVTFPLPLSCAHVPSTCDPLLPSKEFRGI